MQSHNARLGAWLFLVYLLGYGAFVLVNALAPGVMESTPFGGLNLALLSGFGLILLALVLALVYGLIAKPVGADKTDPDRDGRRQRSD